LSGYEKDEAQKFFQIQIVKALENFEQRIEFQCFTDSE